MQHRAFEEQEIEVANRPLDKIVEELSLSAVRAKITAIQQALALSFNQEGVGIGGGVVDEIGSDGELTDGKWLPSLEVAEVEGISISADEDLRGVDQAAG